MNKPVVILSAFLISLVCWFLHTARAARGPFDWARLNEEFTPFHHFRSAWSGVILLLPIRDFFVVVRKSFGSGQMLPWATWIQGLCYIVIVAAIFWRP